jgi:hypothetical protein
MKGLSEALSQQWRTSNSFRVGMILALIGLVINLALTVLWQMELIPVEDSPPANDLMIYLAAGSRFLERQDLYITPGADFSLYAYSPAFAMAASLLTLIPYKIVWGIDALLHIIAYWAIYWRWFVIFRQQGLHKAADALVRLFPLWLIFTGLLYEIAYMNIYIFMALIATMLIEAMLNQQTGRAIFWLAILLPIKPQWAFALGIPFLLGQWRFLAKVLVGGILAYAAIFAITILIAGPYALGQYREYVQTLQSIPHTFVWNTILKEGHIGYNNSIMQLVKFFSNNAPYSVGVSSALKVLLSLPLLAIFWRYRRSASSQATPEFVLEWAFALYLAAFLWLDVVTELTFSILIFTYLLGTLSQQRLRNMARIVFLPYAFAFIWITVSSILSFAIPLPAAMVDPSLFIPVVSLAMLGLYGLLLWQLKNRLSKQVSSETG